MMAASCPSCGGSQAARRHTYTWKNTEFTLRACATCDLWFWTPPLELDHSFYEDESASISDVALGRQTVGSRALGPNQVLFLSRHATSGDAILDVGCGDGLFISASRERGLVACGIDLDGEALRVASRRGLSEFVRRQSLNEFVVSENVDSAEFDAVTAFEVLEHQPRPAEFVRLAISLLKPGGVFAGSVPNRSRLTALLPKLWDRPPYHYTSWDAAALRRFLTQEGLHDVIVEDVGFGYYLPGLLRRPSRHLKRMFLSGIKETILRTCSLEEAAEATRVRGWRLRLLKVAKAVKQTVLAPFVSAESVMERLMGKGHLLYFEGRKPEA